jgi:hypothetical protein
MQATFPLVKNARRATTGVAGISWFVQLTRFSRSTWIHFGRCWVNGAWAFIASTAPFASTRDARVRAAGAVMAAWQ